MITSFTVAGTACFGPNPLEISQLAACNLFFGPNGSGKSTLARGLSQAFSGNGPFKVHGPVEYEAQTYNREYVAQSFSAVLPGVFVLGQDSVDARNRIATLKAQRQAQEAALEGFRKTLGAKTPPSGALGELQAAQDAFVEQAWTKRAEIPHEIQETVLKGTTTSKRVFLSKVLEVAAQEPQGVRPYALLVNEAKSLLGESSSPSSPRTELPDLPANIEVPGELLSRPIVGSSDVRLAPLIEQLGHSDWVRRGVGHLERAGGLCPFCQKPAPADLADELERYFDTQFEADMETLRTAKTNLVAAFNRVRQSLEEIENELEDLLGEETVRPVLDALRVNFQLTENALSEKELAPSQKIAAPPLDKPLLDARHLIYRANLRIRFHNSLISTRDASIASLREAGWAIFVHDTLSAEVAVFLSAKERLDKTVSALEAKIADAELSMGKIDEELAQLERSLTSSKPVIEEVNTLLKSVGFVSFQLVASEEIEDGYEIVREDGQRAEIDTLSEGERTFISYLYFLHTLRQPIKKARTRRIAIIDDPISSLDSDIMFVVSALTRRLMKQVVAGESEVVQLFLFTHNIYFHKEVAHLRHKDSSSGRSHFTIHKEANSPNVITAHGSRNPIQTGYAALWEEVRRAHSKPESAGVGMQNIMRRILENYFRILGNITDDTLIEGFEGEAQVVARSLFSWVNEGSHSIIEEQFFSPSHISTSVYLAVFKEIFYRSNHSAHYEMMMKSFEADS